MTTEQSDNFGSEAKSLEELRSEGLALKRRHVSRFVLRARRASHNSVAQEVYSLANHEETLFSAEGTVRVLEPAASSEEGLEALAAILRPFLLKDMGYKKLVKDVRKLLVEANALTQDVENDLTRLSGLWYFPISEDERKSFNPNNLTLEDYAWAWLYGDSIHADIDWEPVLSSTSFHRRFAAASAIVSRMAVPVFDLLAIVKQHQSVLGLDPKCFTKDVRYDPKKHLEERQVSLVMVGPPGITADEIDGLSESEIEALGFHNLTDSIGPLPSPAQEPAILLDDLEVIAIGGVASSFPITAEDAACLENIDWLDFEYDPKSKMAILHGSLFWNFPTMREVIDHLQIIANSSNSIVGLYALKDEHVGTVLVSPAIPTS